MLKIAVCQLPLTIENPEVNIDLANAAIREAASRGAELIVLPELTNSGCIFRNIAELEVRATTLDGDIISEWIRIAELLKVVIVAGLAIKDSGNFYNASVIIDETGCLGWYKKVHLWNDELDYFTAGEDTPLIVDTEVGRIATMVCYDIEFPEWARLAMLGDASVLAIPMNWPDSGRPSDQTPLPVLLVQAAATQNKMIVAAANRTREERGVSWTGASLIADSDGLISIIADQSILNATQILIADVELPVNRKIGPRNDLKDDRRPDLYRQILN